GPCRTDNSRKSDGTGAYRRGNPSLLESCRGRSTVGWNSSSTGADLRAGGKAGGGAGGDRARACHCARERDGPGIQAKAGQHAAMRILPLAFFLGFLIAQQPSPDARAERPSVSTAEAALAPLVRAHVEQAIRTRDYLKAEQILVHEIDRNPRSPNLLTLAAGVFFLDGKFLNAATALKKAEAVAPLDDRSRFTLAMSYIALDRRDWARPELEKLAQKNADSPLYLYWLARLDYDAQQYTAAIQKLERVITIDPHYMKAYDNLGLCYEAAGRLDDAVATYQRAVDLNRQGRPVSPWPPLNLGTLLV